MTPPIIWAILFWAGIVPDELCGEVNVIVNGLFVSWLILLIFNASAVKISAKLILNDSKNITEYNQNQDGLYYDTDEILNFDFFGIKI